LRYLFCTTRNPRSEFSEDWHCLAVAELNIHNDVPH
jgi:hypothetical protein